DPFVGRSRACRLSRLCEAVLTSSCRVSGRCDISPHSRIGARPVPHESWRKDIEMSNSKSGPRTYNQIQLPRKYASGKRRFSIYWTWSYPWEANRDVTELDNRFSTITEVRRVGWPNFEPVEYSERMFLQGIAGTLELFHLSLVSFQSV